MFLEFHAVVRPEKQSDLHQSTRFEISLEVNGKCHRLSEIIPNDVLVLEGYIDILFNRFISNFKSAASQFNAESGGTIANTGYTQLETDA